MLTFAQRHHANHTDVSMRGCPTLWTMQCVPHLRCFLQLPILQQVEQGTWACWEQQSVAAAFTTCHNKRPKLLMELSSCSMKQFHIEQVNGCQVYCKGTKMARNRSDE